MCFSIPASGRQNIATKVAITGFADDDIFFLFLQAHWRSARRQMGETAAQQPQRFNPEKLSQS
jgi:hypothetical protein